MTIENEKQLANTRAKLALLQDACEKVKKKPGPNAYADELTLRSLQTQIKELKEEIALYETRSAARAPAP
jgi:hypothetical protein